MKSVTVRMPNLGEGSVEVQGLGVFENNTTTEVEDEQVETFIALGGTWPEGDELVVEPPEVEEEAPVVEDEEPEAPEVEEDNAS